MSSGNPSSNSSGGGGPCGACKFLRRKCVAGCIFAPYFDAEQGAAYFAAVHKVFGASNVSKLLLHIPSHRRPDAVVSICYEAQARLRDPIYGCVAHIFNLQQQVVNLQTELSYLQARLAALEVSQPPPAAALLASTPPFCISDLPTISPAAASAGAYDLSSMFDPLLTVSSSSSSCSSSSSFSPLWTNIQQYPRSAEHHFDVSSSSSGGAGDFQVPPETGSSATTIIKRE